ncbi:hypothetical protein MKK84_05845 [Methylobacterium sp. E-065]|uniref:hypothetical protein n=1 Tax=Methylobacterium sp. E-065 TaxID=2836583 RepID=UPI001FBA94BA|nr:hypothetical protein [Methylobacterium sp. E-065]MCJ2016951.1 hypothetical protein [Methylobacterium sp. E-065]
MIRALKNLLGLAQREDATTAELAPSLPAAEAEVAAAQAALAAAKQAYRSSLLTADDTVHSRLDDARREAIRRLHKANALVAALRERLAEAQVREAEVARVTRYEEARQQADDAANALAEWYPRLAEDLTNLLIVVAQAEQLVMDANADLPKGMEAIQAVEGRVRDRPGAPEEIVSEVEVERWVRVGQILPGTFDQDEVHISSNGRGLISLRGMPVNQSYEVELRRFTLQQYRGNDFGYSTDKLASKIVLPGLQHDTAAFYKPLHLPKPADVLARIAELRAQPTHKEHVRAIESRLVPADKSPVKASPKAENNIDDRSEQRRYV